MKLWLLQWRPLWLTVLPIPPRPPPHHNPHQRHTLTNHTLHNPTAQHHHQPQHCEEACSNPESLCVVELMIVCGSREEDEALARAIAASLNDDVPKPKPKSV